MDTTTTPVIRVLPVESSARRRVVNATTTAASLEAKARSAGGLSRLEHARLANARLVLHTALRQGIAR